MRIIAIVAGGFLAAALVPAGLHAGSATLPSTMGVPATSVTIRGTLVGGNPFRPGDRVTPYRVTIFARGDRSRVDIESAEGERAMLLNGGSSDALIIGLDYGVALPTSASGLGPLWLDPQRPCEALKARCERSGQRFMGGQVSEGWKYRGAEGRGPAGTSNGVVWIDPEGGAVLGFESAPSRHGAVNRMEAESVSYDPLPDAIFEVPANVDLPEPISSP